MTDFMSRTALFSQVAVAGKVDALAKQQPYSELSQVMESPG